MSSKGIKKFIKDVQQSKLMTERKMRQELDAKVLYAPIEQKLNHAFGKDFMARFKFYIKKFYEKDEY